MRPSATPTDAAIAQMHDALSRQGAALWRALVVLRAAREAYLNSPPIQSWRGMAQLAQSTAASDLGMLLGSAQLTIEAAREKTLAALARIDG